MAMPSLVRRFVCAALFCGISFFSLADEPPEPLAGADSPTVATEYEKRIRANEEISPLGEDLLGDSVSLYNGALSFSATDVSVPGNFALPVSVGRRFSVGGRIYAAGGHFGDWELDIPHLSGTYASLSTNSWINAASGTDRFNRCTRFEAPPTAAGSTSNGGFFVSYEFWHGVFLHTPGGGKEEVLGRLSGLSWLPADGQTYPLVTTGRWMIRCLPTTATGEPGEAFLALSPDGTQYRFDWMVRRIESTIGKGYSEPNTRGDVEAPGAWQLFVGPARVLDVAHGHHRPSWQHGDLHLRHRRRRRPMAPAEHHGQRRPIDHAHL